MALGIVERIQRVSEVFGLQIDKRVPQKPAGLEHKNHSEPLAWTQEGGHSYVHIMGVKVQRADKPNTDEPIIKFNLTSVSLELLREIAICYNLRLPIIISGDSDIGKTTAIKKFAELIGAKAHIISCNDETTIRRMKGVPTVASGSGKQFAYSDGPISEAMRAKDGEIHLIVLDEVNMLRTDVAGGIHGILDAWQVGGTYETEQEINGRRERFPIPSDRVYFAMTGNPRSDGYKGRKLLDDALARRTHLAYHVRNDALQMLESDAARRGNTAGIKLAQEHFIYSRTKPATEREIYNDPEYNGLFNAYVSFHSKIISMVAAREIGKDQDEAKYFGGQSMQSRVLGFIKQFYSRQNGSLETIFQKALIFFYVLPLYKEDDRSRVFEMIQMVVGEDRPETQGLPKMGATNGVANRDQFHKELGALKTGTEMLRDIARAEKILGPQQVFGPKQIESAFGITVEAAPPIPFSDSELQRAKSLGMVLILRLESFEKVKNTKTSLTLESLKELSGPRFAERGIADVFTNENDLLHSISEIKKEVPYAGWVLVDTAAQNGALVTSNGLTLHDAVMAQTKRLFKNSTTKLGSDYTRMLADYESGHRSSRDVIQKNLKDALSWEKDKRGRNAAASNAADSLSVDDGELCVGMTRQSAIEYLYDSSLYYINTGKQLGGGSPIVTGSTTHAEPSGLASFTFDPKKGYTYRSYSVLGGVAYAGYRTLSAIRGGEPK